MKPNSKQRQKERSDKHNKEIIEALKNGTELPNRVVSDEMGHFPPRPKVKKDKESMEKLYDKEKE